jgi:hypothetical protein
LITLEEDICAERIRFMKKVMPMSVV